MHRNPDRYKTVMYLLFGVCFVLLVLVVLQALVYSQHQKTHLEPIELKQENA